jgi:hypothetical protein
MPNQTQTLHHESAKPGKHEKRRSLRDEARIWTQINPDFSDSEKRKQSVFICGNPCPISLWSPAFVVNYGTRMVSPGLRRMFCSRLSPEVYSL